MALGKLENRGIRYNNTVAKYFYIQCNADLRYEIYQGLMPKVTQLVSVRSAKRVQIDLSTRVRRSRKLANSSDDSINQSNNGIVVTSQNKFTTPPHQYIHVN